MSDDYENTLIRDRWVLIMLDYCADGVWDRELASCGVDELPVSADLARRILAWSDEYETECQSYQGLDDFDYESSSAEGLSIARAVKHELPDWTVKYFDHAAALKYGFSRADDRTEYEIDAHVSASADGTRTDIS